MSLGFFSLGCLFLIAGIAFLAHLMQMPLAYTLVWLVVLAAAGAALTRIQQLRHLR
jgi:hypothetical protein